jgi:hypothetical protein
MLSGIYNRVTGYEVVAISGKYSRRNCERTELAKGTSIGRNNTGLRITAQGREKGENNNET